MAASLQGGETGRATGSQARARTYHLLESTVEGNGIAVPSTCTRASLGAGLPALSHRPKN